MKPSQILQSRPRPSSTAPQAQLPAETVAARALSNFSSQAGRILPINHMIAYHRILAVLPIPRLHFQHQISAHRVIRSGRIPPWYCVAWCSGTLFDQCIADRCVHRRSDADTPLKACLLIKDRSALLECRPRK